MTDVTVESEIRDPVIVDPAAFALALIGAPLLVTVLTCWALIPIFALVLGGPIYLLVGTPLLWRALRSGKTSGWALAELAFFANMAVAPIVAVLSLFDEPDAALIVGMVYFIFGSIFAPLWAAAFAWLYAGPKPSIYTQT
ncbi:MAG: hypothetical protein AAFQ66_04145 [Pseudomonadota bacterium]